MLTLKAKIREKLGKKVKTLRKKEILPAVLYGPKTKNIYLEVNFKDFKNIYKKSGESSLINLEIEKKNFPVLIHEIERDPITDEPIHIDFYQPILTKKIEAVVPLVFEGVSPAVKELGGTLVREIQEIKVKALPQDLPHEIRVNVEKIKTFDDEILVKDLKVPSGVEIQRKPEEIVAVVVPAEKLEEELQKPVAEKEEVEKVEKIVNKERKEEKEEKEEKKEGK